MSLRGVSSPIPTERISVGSIPAADAKATVSRIASRTAIGLAILAWVAALAWYAAFAPRSFAFDYDFYRDLGARFLAGEPYYLPHQLDGPYSWRGQVDNLYPPAAVLVFASAALLPPIFWWAVPLTVLAYAVASWRPTRGAVAIALLCLSTPKALSAGVMGNTDLWLLAGVAGGLLWGWPAVFLVLKPTLAPFALVGIWHRSWWITVALLAAFGIATLPMWSDYVTAMRNLRDIPWTYSLVSIPIAVAPIVLWYGRSRGRTRDLSGDGS